MNEYIETRLKELRAHHELLIANVNLSLGAIRELERMQNALNNPDPVPAEEVENVD